VRIAFATASVDDLPVDDMDRPFHESAFAAAGLNLDHCQWRDPTVRWDGYDLVVVRSVWDYVERLDEFTAWLQRVGAIGRLANPAPVIGWNLDKRYLLDLEERGTPVIPTSIVADLDGAVSAARRLGGEVVVKPVVSAGSRLTGRFDAGHPALPSLVTSILAEGREVIIQPAVSSVAEAGEVGVVVFAGSVSHAFRKGPLLAPGGGLLHGHRELVTPETLTTDQMDVAAAAVGSVERLISERFGISLPLLYARVDLVRLDDGSHAVLEVELAEPAFFLSTDPEAAPRFARAVARHAAALSEHARPA
jgi:hypothetical protein